LPFGARPKMVGHVPENVVTYRLDFDVTKLLIKSVAQLCSAKHQWQPDAARVLPGSFKVSRL